MAPSLNVSEFSRPLQGGYFNFIPAEDLPVIWEKLLMKNAPQLSRSE
ncbi:hypothetical protein V462_11220 [Pantoea ananatis 15320]|nr:hypothetical protein [Pantoea ananatis]PKC36138.1 hypothetical protein V462_11220 [Pantoea ananatis 15320]